MRDSTTPFMWLAFGTLNCYSKCVRSAASSRLRCETSHESIASRSGRCAPWKFLPRSLKTVVGCTPRRETNRRDVAGKAVPFADLSDESICNGHVGDAYIIGANMMYTAVTWRASFLVATFDSCGGFNLRVLFACRLLRPRVFMLT